MMKEPRGSYWQPKSAEEKTLAGMILATLAERGVLGWTVIFSRESNRLGYCRFDSKEICISRKVVVTDWSQAVDTAMHEVAHALAGKKAKHGPIWKAMAQELGARPNAKAEYVNLHQTGERKTVKTIYGTVDVTVGSKVEVYGAVGTLKILEIQRKFFIGESALGSRYQLSVDLLHPSYGTTAVAQRKATVKDRRNRPVEITLGESSYVHEGVKFVAVEAKRRNVLTMDTQGNTLLVPAELFRK